MEVIEPAMYEIEAIVTTATPTELKVTGDWPLDWLQAPGIRSIEIQRKVLPIESLHSPGARLRNKKFLVTGVLGQIYNFVIG
jgi:hypothetical protein